MEKENHKLKKRNVAVQALYIWIKIKYHENKQQNILNKNLNLSKGYKLDLLQEIKKNIVPIISQSKGPILLGEDIKLKWFETMTKRDLDFTYNSLNKFKGIIEFKNVNKLNPDDIRLMSRYIKYQFYPKNSFIFKEGDTPKYLYIIIKGNIQVIERKFLDRTQEIKELLVREENILNNKKNKKKEENENESTNEEDSEEEKNIKFNENIEDLSLEAYWRRKESIFLKKERQKRRKIKKFLERYDPEKNRFQISKSLDKQDNDYISFKIYF